jgi:hypothetical protein
MADPIYVACGPMSYTNDSKKADKKYADKAKLAMKTAAERTIKANHNFTLQKPKDGKGYGISLTVSEVTIDEKAKTVACKLTGVVTAVPQNKMITAGLSGSAKAQGGSDVIGGVADCVDAVTEDLVKNKILPALLKHP